MKKIDLGQSVAILANLGVIVGIVFLGVEIRQNTQSIEIGAYQDLMSQIARMNEVTIEYQEEALAAFGDTSWDELQSDILVRRKGRQMHVMMFRHGDMAFYQLDRRVIPEDRFDAAIAVIRINICQPNVRETWDLLRSNRSFTSEYIAHIERLTEECERL